MQPDVSDPDRFRHFLDAQASVYEQVLAELRRGRKQSHWMWFVFPQLAGLGHSPMSIRFALATLGQARDYAAHPVLGARLRQCTQAVLDVPGRSLHDIFGSPDDLKFRSCMTLFAAAVPGEPRFRAALERYCGGQGDENTLRLLRQA